MQTAPTNDTTRTPRAADHLPPALAIAAAWSLYLPLGLQYLAFLACFAGGLVIMARRERVAEMARHPLFLLPATFWFWTALSASWSSAPPGMVGSQLWYSALPLALMPIAWALRPHDARLAMRHFIAVSAVVGLLLPLVLADRITGNQRIAFSLLLALASSWAVIEALDARAWRRRLPWLAAAGLCAAGVALQDRRTGMLVLPLLLVMLVWLRQPNAWRRMLLSLGLVAASLAIGYCAEPVRTRIVEGVAEVQAYRSQGDVSTSLGMRLRLLETSAEMIQQRPWFGHGAGSWLGLWRSRVQGGELLQAHTTPHNEYLLIAVQTGAVGLALFGAALLAFGRAAWRRRSGGEQALLVWLAFVATALVNVTLRDAKFALPLLILAALAWAASEGRRTGC